MKKTIFFGLIIFFSLQTAFSSKKNSDEKPKLIVGIVVEQMRYDYIFRYWDKFSDNGFKKLIDGGTFCKNANYSYLLNNSSSAYATIATGTTPCNHGIVADTWYIRLKNYERYCVSDRETFLVGISEKEKAGYSPKSLISTAWSDELKLSNFKMSKVISIGMKDYAAILSGGLLADEAYWLDENTGDWITSTYYGNNLKSWVKDFNSKNFADTYLGRTWDTKKAQNEYRESLADDNSFEVGFFGQRTFPYNLAELKTKTGDYSILSKIPSGNTYTKDFALYALLKENLGKDQYTDYLFVSFPATGNISDIFGIRSIEVQDAYMRLDADIAHLITSLEDLVGKENFVIYLTADRGAGDVPEMLDQIGMKSRYFDAKSSLVILSSYLRILYGNKDWIETLKDNQVYLNREQIEDAKLSLPEFQRTAANFMVQFSGVSNAVAVSDLKTSVFTGSSILAKAQRSYNQERSGDIFVTLSPGWAVKPERDEFVSLSARNYSYSENSHVPLIWYGWKIPKQQVYRQINITDIASTLSYILDINHSGMNTGEPIVEILNTEK